MEIGEEHKPEKPTTNDQPLPKQKPTKEELIGGLITLIAGCLALFGWFHVGLILKIILYIIAVAGICFGAFAVIDVVTPRANASYASATMLAIFGGFLYFLSIMTSIKILH